MKLSLATLYGGRIQVFLENNPSYTVKHISSSPIEEGQYYVIVVYEIGRRWVMDNFVVGFVISCFVILIIFQLIDTFIRFISGDDDRRDDDGSSIWGTI